MHTTLNTALTAGAIMLSNGSETYRVQNTIAMILDGNNYHDYDILVIGTGMVVTINSEDQIPLTMTKTVNHIVNNLEKISLVAKTVNQFYLGKLSLDQTMEELKKIDTRKPYSIPVKILATALGTGAFTIGFGATPLEGLVTFLITLLPAAFIQFANKRDVSFFLRNLVAGSVVALSAATASSIYPLLNLDQILASVIIILTPGVMAVTAVRDMVNGDFITGSSRAIEALMLALSLSIGVGAVFTLWFSLQGGIVWTY